MIGGQGGDRITTGDGDDDIIGGHNVAHGSDGDDTLDGGAGNDWIAGDNAEIWRTGLSYSVRYRTLLGRLDLRHQRPSAAGRRLGRTTRTR